jgi:Holliday junction DNA helicase RuvA
MIDRMRGTLEAIEGNRALVQVGAGGLILEVLCPAFFALRLQPSVGSSVQFFTMLYLEGQGQGSSFEPRLLGFASASDRAFFEALTSVSGIGNRKALRALVHEPGAIARAIIEKDAKFLSTLPEIGKRMAERLITELDGKVEAFAISHTAGAKPTQRIEAKGTLAGFSPAAQDAVAALVALGQQRSDAEEAVQRALARAAQHSGPDAPGHAGVKATDVESILASVFAAR